MPLKNVLCVIVCAKQTGRSFCVPASQTGYCTDTAGRSCQNRASAVCPHCDVPQMPCRFYLQMIRSTTFFFFTVHAFFPARQFFAVRAFLPARQCFTVRTFLNVGQLRYFTVISSYSSLPSPIFTACSTQDLQFVSGATFPK